MMHALEVGKLFLPGKTTWPQGGGYAFRAGAHELHLFLPSPSVSEVRAVRTGVANFAIAVEPPIIFFLYRFARAIAWSRAPFSWHLVSEDQRALPESGEPETRALLHIVLVDANTGLVRAHRLVAFAPTFTSALHDAIWAQAVVPWPGQLLYDAALAAIYCRFPAPEDLLAQALVRTEGGV